MVINQQGIIEHTEGWLKPYLKEGKEQTIGQHFREVLHEKWGQSLVEAIEKLAQGDTQNFVLGTTANHPLRVYRPVHSLFQSHLIVELRASIQQEVYAHHSPDAHTALTSNTAQWPNTLERLETMMAQQAISDSSVQKSLELAAEVVHLAVWNWYPQENQIMGNEAFCAMYGLGPLFQIHQWQEQVHPADREAIDEQVNGIINGDLDLFDPAYRYTHPSTGTQHFYQERGLVMQRTADGLPLLVTGVTLDLTESWVSQQQLEEALYFLAKVTENAGYAIYVHDLEEGLDIFTNSAYQELLGYHSDEINAWSMAEFFEHIHPYDREAYKNHYQRLRENGDSATIEYRFLLKDGEWIWCLAKDSIFEKSHEQAVKKYIGILIDITERKEMEQALLEAKRKAEAANIYKNAFLTNMSHEIRTPMNGVVACSQLLDDDTLPAEERHQFIQIIQNSSRQLLRLIDDIIDIARMEAGELSIQYEHFQVREFVEDVFQSFQAVLNSHQQKTLGFELHAELPSLEVDMYSDRDRLQQVLMNLLGNAMKYSHQGSIQLHCFLRDDKVHFSVHDQGIGIPQEHFNSIFERFNQVEYRSRVKYGGQGLGLAICKGLLEQLGGSISVESEVNKGSIFRISLPLIPAFHQQELAKEKRLHCKPLHAPLAGKTVLLVDDEPNILHYLLKALEPCGAQLLCARNGEEALEIYRKTPRIDAVLMDIRMPLMDGIKATRELMKIDPKALVIIQSAFVMPEERDRSFAAGCKAYLTKPLDKDLLIHTLEQVF